MNLEVINGSFLMVRNKLGEWLTHSTVMGYLESSVVFY